MLSQDETTRIILNTRWYAYRLFQSLLGGEPTNDQLKIVFSDITNEALELFDNGQDDYHKAFEEWTATCNKLQEQVSTQNIEPLKDEYTKAFLDPTKGAPFPWESQYLTHDPSIFQEHTLQVRNAYRTQGFIPAEYPHVADDHIALECGFMASLAERAQEAYAQEDIAKCIEALLTSQTFLDEHLLKWLPTYAADMATVEWTDFYAAVIAMLAEFALSDRTLLTELIEDKQ